MALARVVTFDGVSAERMAQMESQMDGGPPEGLDATEIIALHDADAQRAVVIIFFDDEDAYRRGDEILSAMPADETPGQRSSIAKYEVAQRMTN
jgi:hypothetical protein